MKVIIQKLEVKTRMPIICLLLIISSVNAQWKTYTNTNFINDIIGNNTNLYCATLGGFTIFSLTDRTFVKTYTNADGFSNNRIQKLCFDPLGNVWLGTNRGLAVYEPNNEKVSTYVHEDLAQYSVSCLSHAGDTILVGTQSGLFIIDTKGTLSIGDDIVTQPILPSAFSSKIFSVVATNSFWVGTSPGIIKLNRDLQTYTQYLHPFGDSVKAMTVVFDTLYIATEQGLAKYDGTTFVPVVYFPQSYLVYVLTYSNDNFYVATSAGLFRYNGQTLVQLSNEDTRTAFVSDGVWVGVGGSTLFGGGLRNYLNNSWQIYWSSGLASNSAGSVVVDTEGTIYTTHYPTLTSNYKTISYKEINADWQLLYDSLINSSTCVVDQNNCAWFGHWAKDGGVSCFDPARNTWQTIMWTSWHYRNVIGAIGVDKRNVKWTYNQYSTIIAIDSVGQQTYEFSIPGLSRPEQEIPYEFAFDIENRVWLGTSVGLVKIDYNNTLSDQSDDSYRIYRQGLPDQEVNSVAVDVQNRVWCATVQGAAVFNNDSFDVYTTDNSSLLSNKIIRVKTDLWGNVWFLTPIGVSQFNIYTKVWLSYTSENSGLIPNLDNDDKFYRWLYVDDLKGYLLVATKEGISQFFYRSVNPVTLAEVRVYPNPFILSTHQILTFDSLPSNAIVTVYTIDGKFITELKVVSGYSGVRWEPKSVASGIYLAVVKSGHETRIAKFAIVR